MRRWEILAMILTVVFGAVWLLDKQISKISLFWGMTVTIVGMILFYLKGFNIIYSGLSKIPILQKYIGEKGAEDATLRFWIEGIFLIIFLLLIIPIVMFIATNF